jgi:hypothetical protein
MQNDRPELADGEKSRDRGKNPRGKSVSEVEGNSIQRIEATNPAPLPSARFSGPRAASPGGCNRGMARRRPFQSQTGPDGFPGIFVVIFNRRRRKAGPEPLGQRPACELGRAGASVGGAGAPWRGSHSRRRVTGIWRSPPDPCFLGGPSTGEGSNTAPFGKSANQRLHPHSQFWWIPPQNGLAKCL